MPKKFKGENSKAAEARARKEAKKVEEQQCKQEAIDDQFWQDDDKHVHRKQQRKDDKARKHQEQMERKQEKERLYAEEMSSIKPAKPPPAAKLTRADIEEHKDKMAALAAKSSKEVQLSHDEVPLEENVNKMIIEGDQARSVQEAISVLSVADSALDKHPERRMRAAYLAFEEKYLPILKQENPNLRLSQLKQLLKKDWMKSPENPMNQQSSAYNVK